MSRQISAGWKCPLARDVAGTRNGTGMMGDTRLCRSGCSKKTITLVLREAVVGIVQVDRNRWCRSILVLGQVCKDGVQAHS